MADHYSNCIKLSAENKISTKNAFSLQLIDYMATMIKQKESNMSNFQVAAGTLDASTKIYAYRYEWQVPIRYLRYRYFYLGRYRYRVPTQDILANPKLSVTETRQICAKLIETISTGTVLYLGTGTGTVEYLGIFLYLYR